MASQLSAGQVLQVRFGVNNFFLRRQSDSLTGCVRELKIVNEMRVRRTRVMLPIPPFGEGSLICPADIFTHAHFDETELRVYEF